MNGDVFAAFDCWEGEYSEENEDLFGIFYHENDALDACIKRYIEKNKNKVNSEPCPEIYKEMYDLAVSNPEEFKAIYINIFNGITTPDNKYHALPEFVIRRITIQ